MTPEGLLAEPAPTLGPEASKQVSSKKPAKESLGARLQRLRKAKGLTQLELARAIGTSQRMISYYESRDGLPVPRTLLKLARALGTTPEGLLGPARQRADSPSGSPENLRLWRKLKQVEKLPPAERRAIVRYVEALVERSNSRRERAS